MCSFLRMIVSSSSEVFGRPRWYYCLNGKGERGGYPWDVSGVVSDDFGGVSETEHPV